MNCNFKKLVLVTSSIVLFLGIYSLPTGPLIDNQAFAEEGKDLQRSFAVVELFTSQGCSSCPPADKLLEELKKEARTKNLNIFPLSFHVDYWNYLGWKDPYSGKNPTARQQEYARAFSRRGVYTPQMVINGTTEFPGNRRASMQKAIKDALDQHIPQDISLSLSTETKDSNLIVSFEVSEIPSDSVLQLAVVNESIENYVPKGENSGSTLSHTNVVRQLITVPLKKERKGKVDVSISEDAQSNNMSVIGFIQDRKSKKILMAARAS
jgi:hypothetical protein